MLQPIRVQTGPNKVESAVLHVVDMEASNADKRFTAMVRCNPLHTFLFNSTGKLLVLNDAAKQACLHSTAGLKLPEGQDITLQALFELGTYAGESISLMTFDCKDDLYTLSLEVDKAAKQVRLRSTAGLKLPEGHDVTLQALLELGTYAGDFVSLVTFDCSYHLYMSWLVLSYAAKQACLHSMAALKLPEGQDITLQALLELGIYVECFRGTRRGTGCFSGCNARHLPFAAGQVQPHAGPRQP